jgi:predicted phosphate transport protein (TIGR00153 family)
MAIGVSRFTGNMRNRQFFNLFEEAGANAERAGALLHRLLESWPDDGGTGREILICEQEGDRITHDVIELLNRKISPPFDRDDVYKLASALDDVVDYTEEAADFLALYHVEAPMEQAQELSGVLRDCCRSLASALSALNDIERVHPKLVEVHRLENEGDRIVRAALAALFSNGVDPMFVVRWKDIFERIEQAIDACETAAHVIETIAVKQS